MAITVFRSAKSSVYREDFPHSRESDTPPARINLMIRRLSGAGIQENFHLRRGF